MVMAMEQPRSKSRYTYVWEEQKDREKRDDIEAVTWTLKHIKKKKREAFQEGENVKKKCKRYFFFVEFLLDFVGHKLKYACTQGGAPRGAKIF